MRTCVQDNKRIQDNERIKRRPKSHPKRKNLTSEISISKKECTRAERRRSSYGPCERKKRKKIRQTDKSYLIMQLFICITRPERTILANYVQRSGPRCQAKHDGQRDQRSYDSTGWYDFQTSTNRTDNSNKFTTNQQVPQEFPLNAPRCRSVICIRHISPPTCRHYDDNSTN